MQGLLPQEEILEQVNVTLQRIEGILLITNVRVLWKRVGDNIFMVNENRLHIKSVMKAQDTSKKDRYVMKIVFLGKPKGSNFSFEGISANVISERIEKMLSNRID